MNCESVHTHWIVLCLKARRTSDDPPVSEGWLWGCGWSAPPCLPGDNLFQGHRAENEQIPRWNLFVDFFWAFFLMKSALEKQQHTGALVPGWQSATQMCWRNWGGAAARVGGQRERAVGGRERGRWRSGEKWQLVHRRRRKRLNTNGRGQQMTTQWAPLKQFTLDDRLWDAPLPVRHCASLTVGIQVYIKYINAHLVIFHHDLIDLESISWYTFNYASLIVPHTCCHLLSSSSLDGVLNLCHLECRLSYWGPNGWEYLTPAVHTLELQRTETAGS